MKISKEMYLKIYEKKFNLPLNKWEGFLLKWCDTIQNYGTSLDFVKDTTYQTMYFKLENKSFPIIIMESPNCEKRKILMKKQKQYKPLENLRKYGLNLDFKNCFLCQNIVRSIDSEKNPNISDNKIYSLDGYKILPNKYPSQPGHSLFVPVNHDNMKSRVSPKVKKDTLLWCSKEGKTRGHILGVKEFSTLINICDKYNLLATSNHILDAMSIPGHWHYHLFPEDLPSFDLMDFVLNKKEKTEFEEGIYNSGNSPFDTLIIEKNKIKEFSKMVCSILKKLEKDNQVYTTIYCKGHFFISPRKNVGIEKICTGSGISIHLFDSKEDLLYKIRKYIPMKGEFLWKKYITPI